MYSSKVHHIKASWSTSKRMTEHKMEVVTVTGVTAKDFMKNLGQYNTILQTCTLRDVKDCSIDGIKVKQGEFRSVVQGELDREEKQRLKEIPPIQHLGFTTLDVDMYGLYRVGREIFVRRPPNEAEFFKVLERTNEGAIRTLYHGTNATNMQSIVMSGLHVSKSGAFGRGLYVGPWEKAINYTNKGLRWRWSGNKPKQYKTMLELDVIVGKCLKADKLDKVQWQKEYDSVYYDGFRNAEYCLRDANQALIKKIILL